MEKASPGSLVLDPMAGSGTTLAVARALGLRALGFDTDPLAVMMANAWSLDCDEHRLKAKALDIVDRAADVARNTSIREAYPRTADDETKSFLRYWFDGRSRKELMGLSTAIGRVRDSSVRALLWCAFSRLIITKTSGASLAMDVSHSRPHKVYTRAPISPLDKFSDAVDRVSYVMKMNFSGASGRSIKIQSGDARKLNVPDETADLVVTSPPYLNAIDYLRGHRLSLVWMGYTVSQLREIRAHNIGTEAAGGVIDRDLIKICARMGATDRLPGRIRRMIFRYLEDMRSVMREAHRVLKVGGSAFFVVGDSSIRNTYVSNSRAIAELAVIAGFKVIDIRSRPIEERRRYLPISSRVTECTLSRRMRHEVLIELERCA